MQSDEVFAVKVDVSKSKTMKNSQSLFAASEERKIYQARAVDFGSRRASRDDPAKQRSV